MNSSFSCVKIMPKSYQNVDSDSDYGKPSRWKPLLPLLSLSLSLPRSFENIESDESDSTGRVGYGESGGDFGNPNGGSGGGDAEDKMETGSVGDDDMDLDDDDDDESRAPSFSWANSSNAAAGGAGGAIGDGALGGGPRPPINIPPEVTLLI